MAFNFDFLKQKVGGLAQSGVAKAKELTEISKLKMQNSNEQAAIRKAYLEMGKMYYNQHNTTAEGPYAILCQQVTRAKGNIAYNNQRIADLKEAGNLTDAEASMDSDDVDI